MKDLKDYIKEDAGLKFIEVDTIIAEWTKLHVRESILDDIDDQLDRTDEIIIKKSIIKWLKENVNSIQENKLKFDFKTTPVMVNYDGDIKFKTNIKSLTNENFQWNEVGGEFNCTFCRSLTSLKGGPKKVGKRFDCGYCESLESLECGPKKVEGDFSCSDCKSLKSLEGAPKEVGGYFDCDRCNSLESLEGAPKKVRGNFYCYDCGSTFTENDVKKVSKIKVKIYNERP